MWGRGPCWCMGYDCTDHMVEWKKKDAEHVKNYFKKNAIEWDESYMYMDCFFDRAANVKNWTNTVNHLASSNLFSLCRTCNITFFSDLSKLKPIKVISIENFPAISSGQGHVLKSQGQNEMVSHFLYFLPRIQRFRFFLCPCC